MTVYFIVFRRTAECRRKPNDRITVAGIPIHPVFSQPMDLGLLRKKFNIDPSIPVVLLSAGTFGMDSSIVAIRALMHMELPAQIVALCGNNGDLHHIYRQARRSYDVGSDGERPARDHLK